MHEKLVVSKRNPDGFDWLDVIDFKKSSPRAESQVLFGGNGWMSMLYWTPGTVIGMAWSLSLSFSL